MVGPLRTTEQRNSREGFVTQSHDTTSGQQFVSASSELICTSQSYGGRSYLRENFGIVTASAAA